MRGFTLIAAVALIGVVTGVVGPLVLEAQHEPGPARGRFRDVFRVGDHVLARSSVEIMHLTLVSDEELPQVRLTDEERREYEALRGERSSFGAFRPEPGESGDEHRRRTEEQMRRARERQARMSELQRKMRLREIVLAGEDYIGLRDAEGETTYVPLHRIGSVTQAGK